MEGYNPLTKGYDLDFLTKGLFDRFTSTYIYDMTNKKIIPEIQSDDKIKMELSGDTYMYRFSRAGNEIIFQPDIPEGLVIEFYYQMDAIAFTGTADNREYQDVFNSDIQKALLDDKMLVRGAVNRYAIATSYPNDKEAIIFDGYVEKIKGSRSPKGILSGYNGLYGFNEAIDILGLPLF
jgi:hypothetical protein